MKIYIDPTDAAWFNYLKAHSPHERVNFWQPGGGRAFSRLDPGDLFIFRLKSPINMLAGGGRYAGSLVMGIGAAWEVFGDKNGVPDYPTFRDAIAKYKRHWPSETLPYDSPIGCIILRAPVFLNQVFWRPVPDDYHKNLIQGRVYHSASETGKRLLAWANEMFLA